MSNAVAKTQSGVRVPELPLTPDRVLAALEKGGSSLMQAFAYARPKTLAEAIALLGSMPSQRCCRPRRRHRLAQFHEGQHRRSPARGKHQRPARARGIIEGTVRWGLAHPRARHPRRAGLAPAHRGTIPASHQAAADIASPQTRNMATVAGNLLQRPRCWYYRGGFGLLARDDQGRPLVPAGDNRYHAIFGNSGPAYFVSPSSLAPALIALGARSTSPARAARAPSLSRISSSLRKKMASASTPSRPTKSLPKSSSPRTSVAATAPLTKSTRKKRSTGRSPLRRSR